MSEKPTMKEAFFWAKRIREKCGFCLAPGEATDAADFILSLASLEAAPVEGEVTAKIDKAHDLVVALCKPRNTAGSREWMMSIPARPDYDPDLVIGDALTSSRKAIVALSRENARLKARPMPEEVERLAEFLEEGGEYQSRGAAMEQGAAAELLRSLATENAALSRRVAELEGLPPPAELQAAIEELGEEGVEEAGRAIAILLMLYRQNQDKQNRIRTLERQLGDSDHARRIGLNAVAVQRDRIDTLERRIEEADRMAWNVLKLPSAALAQGSERQTWGQLRTQCTAYLSTRTEGDDDD